jgi:hypothetical protein
MNSRINEIIKYKTDGCRTDFAARMGWSRQYLSKLLRGVDLGITPVRSILATFPDIDARWLLLGEGKMIRKH